MLCTVYDSVTASTSSFTDLPFTRDVKRHVKSARMRYYQYLEDTKKARLDTQRAKKRAGIQDDITHAEKKKKLVEGTMLSLEKEADQLAKDAEKKQDLTLLSKSNAFCKKATEKAEEQKSLEKRIQELRGKLKE